jgi:hypothetical protein
MTIPIKLSRICRHFWILEMNLECEADIRHGILLESPIILTMAPRTVAVIYEKIGSILRHIHTFFSGISLVLLSASATLPFRGLLSRPGAGLARNLGTCPGHQN